MRTRGWIALALGLALPVAAPAMARADEITLNVPVSLTNVASNVTRGRVECLVDVAYEAPSRGGASGQAKGREDHDSVRQQGLSSEFAIDATGTYNGTQTVRAQVAPPRLWVDEGRAISVRAAGYTCHVQLATPTSDWYPSLNLPRDAATGRATGRRMEGDAPEWAQLRGATTVVTGNLNIPASARATR